MKKILFISVFMILSAVGMAQLTGTYLKVYSKTTPVGRSLPDSTVILVKNQAAFYMTTRPMTATQTVQYMIDSSYILTIASGTSSATIADMSVTSVTASTATVTTLAVTGGATTKSITTTGAISVTGSISSTAGMTSTGTFFADSSMYFGDDGDKVWRRFFYQQMGTPSSRGVIENMADYYIQAKDGLSQILILKRDSTLTDCGVDILNVVKQVYLGKDTTGIGSTANIGTTLYYNGHFYGLIESTPPSWKQLDN